MRNPNFFWNDFFNVFSLSRRKVASLDGQKLIKDSLSAPREQAEKLGQDLALKLREQGAGEFLAEILAEVGRG